MALQAQKTKNDPADPVGQVLKLSFKAAFTELPEEARSRERGGGGGGIRREQEWSLMLEVSISLPLQFTLLFSVESQHQVWMFTSGCIIEFFTRYNLPQDWSCRDRRNCIQDPPSTWLHIS